MNSEDAALKETPHIGLGPVVVPSGRIQKKFKWEGELQIESDKGVQRLCNVTLNEASEPRPFGLQLKICLAGTQSLHLRKLHDVSDIYLILPACAAVTQFCKLTSSDEEDTRPFTVLEKHMKRRRLVSSSFKIPTNGPPNNKTSLLTL